MWFQMQPGGAVVHTSKKCRQSLAVGKPWRIKIFEKNDTHKTEWVLTVCDQRNLFELFLGQVQVLPQREHSVYFANDALQENFTRVNFLRINVSRQLKQRFLSSLCQTGTTQRHGLKGTILIIQQRSPKVSHYLHGAAIIEECALCS